MAVPGNRYQQTLPMIGGIVLLFVFFSLLLMCVMVDVMQVALRKLHLDPGWAALIVMGIFIGSLFNIPVRRFPRDELQPVVRGAIYGLGVWHPVVRHVRSETVLAVNVGGCVIPTAVALYELPFIVNGGLQPILALVIAVTVNVAVCYRFATLVDGVGIAMPAFLAPAAAVLIAWLLLAGSEFAGVRAPVAFVAGVSGPLIGADLFHLRQITKVSTGMVSIGGAGTFDGIVFSSILAALIA